jgi:hypothetical protein
MTERTMRVVRARHGVLQGCSTMTSGSKQSPRGRLRGRPLCGAKTRAGGSCKVRAEPGKARCRFHGGKSTGPRTQAGRGRIAESQRRRWRDYRAAADLLAATYSMVRARDAAERFRLVQ